MIAQADFTSSFVRAYLRRMQADEGFLSGVFAEGPGMFVWGAIAEYGDPPLGALLVEMWSDQNEEGDKATFRFWHGVLSKKEVLVRGRVVMYDEIETSNGQGVEGG